MHKTQFAGLTAPDPDDAALQVDGGSFATRNPDLTDYFLSIGCITHRHDAHAALGRPALAASAQVIPSGGVIPSDAEIGGVWTVTDRFGGETTISPGFLVTTPAPAQAPSGSIDVTFSSASGVMPVGQYGYAITIMDAGGGETTVGAVTYASREPGFASGQMLLSGLSQEFENVGDRWRLYRTDNGGPLNLIAVGTDDTFLDYGIDPVDHAAQPPFDSTRTNSTNLLQVKLPMASGASANAVLNDPNAVSINLYLSEDGAFISPSLYNVYPIASAGAVIDIPTLDLQVGQPPDVATSIGGANLIDPDRELLDWHWKRPVAASGDLPTGSGTASGDVRVVLADGQPYRFIDGAWGEWAMGGGGSGVSRLPIDTTGGSDANMPIWTKNGVDVLWLRGHENLDDVTVMSQDFSGASGAIGDGYALDGSGNAIPQATSDNTNAIHYPAVLHGFGTTFYDGYVERVFTVTSNNWTRIGVTLGVGRVGLFAWIEQVSGNLVIATRTVDSNLEADFTVIATDPLPAAPSIGDTYTLRFDRTGNRLDATVHQSKALVAEAQIDIPAPLQADFGEGVGLAAGLGDRWSNPDAWTTDSAIAVWHRHLRELYVEALTDQGTTVSRQLFDGVGERYGFISSQFVGAYSTDWADDTSFAFFYERTTEGWLKFMGKAVKSTGSAPVNGEVIATLDAEAIPVNGDFVVPVVTGDDDGEQLGMVKITATGDVVWLDGKSTAPATKHPYVVFDGVPSYPTV